MIVGIVAGQGARISAPPVGTDLVWDALNKRTFTLEDSGLSVVNRTGSSATGFAKALPVRTHGRWYFEMNFISPEAGGALPDLSDTVGAGVVSTTASAANYIGGQGQDGVGFWNKGNFYKSGSSFSVNPARRVSNVSDVIGIAFDCATGGLWFSKNGVWTDGNPANADAPLTSITTGLSYVIAATPEDAGYGVRLRETLTYEVPTGFSQW